MRRQFARALLRHASSHGERVLSEEQTRRRGPRSTIRFPYVCNENFLDVNVYANVGSASRRLGMVTGNSAGDFTIDWSASIGQPIDLIGDSDRRRRRARDVAGAERRLRTDDLFYGWRRCFVKVRRVSVIRDRCRSQGAVGGFG